GNENASSGARLCGTTQKDGGPAHHRPSFRNQQVAGSSPAAGPSTYSTFGRLGSRMRFQDVGLPLVALVVLNPPSVVPQRRRRRVVADLLAHVPELRTAHEHQANEGVAAVVGT